MDVCMYVSMNQYMHLYVVFLRIPACVQFRTPLYDAELFPRTITVFISAYAAGAGGAFTARDVDATTSKGVVLVAGQVPSYLIREQIANIAAEVMHMW